MLYVFIFLGNFCNVCYLFPLCFFVLSQAPFLPPGEQNAVVRPMARTHVPGDTPYNPESAPPNWGEVLAVAGAAYVVGSLVNKALKALYDRACYNIASARLNNLPGW